LGGEAAHGVLILSPRAVARLESHQPPWPMPKLFRLTKADKVNSEIFEGATINTPSMLCVEDFIDALRWAAAIGGLEELQRRADRNLSAIEDWVRRTSWVDFLASDRSCRSNTSVCLAIVDPAVRALTPEGQADFAKRVASLLEREGGALDIGGYRDAPPGLRVWCGPTVDCEDIEALTPWLDWAFATVVAELTPA
jgi:phosphoserine aminotransferase